MSNHNLFSEPYEQMPHAIIIFMILRTGTVRQLTIESKQS